jgi:hypothetical protein
MTAMISLEGYGDEIHGKLEYAKYDMHKSDDVLTVLQVFGNGCYDEVRVKGESREAILLFVAMLNKGGYYFGNSINCTRKLYANGFGTLPEDDPFIFIDPIASNGEVYVMNNVHEKEDIIRNSKPWWKFW